MNAPKPARPFRLSDRELEVLQLIAQGLSNPEIGRRLFIEPNTVKTHLSRVSKRMGCHGRAAVVAMAIRSGALVVDGKQAA